MKHRLRIEEIERVVVRGTNWVGDAVMTVPAMRELRRVLPHAHITLATRSWAEGLFQDATFINELLIHDRSANKLNDVWRQASAWRASRCDLALLLPNSFEAALIAAFARVPYRLGYATDHRSLLLTHSLALPRWRKARHEVFYYLNIVAQLEQLLTGASNILERAPHSALDVSNERRQAARELLQAHGAGYKRLLVALCPGSTNSRAKRWPAHFYAALADRLIEESGADVALIGAPNELEVSDEVAALMRHTPLMLTGRTSLAELVAVLSICDLLVTNDTGPAHIAAALGRHVLVIFGPTDPTTTRPFSEQVTVIRRPPACAPCMLRDCPIDHRCMTMIAPAEVFDSAAAILRTARAEDEVLA